MLARHCAADLPSRRIFCTQDLEKPPVEDFEIALQSRIQRAKEQGKRSLGVRFGDLHREVGGYTRINHRMTLCCAVMREAMRKGDAVESYPEGG